MIRNQSVEIRLQPRETGWRWTLHDEFGRTQGWEPNFLGGSRQAHTVLLAHERSQKRERLSLGTAEMSETVA